MPFDPPPPYSESVFCSPTPFDYSSSCSQTIRWPYRRLTVRLYDYMRADTYSEFVEILNGKGELDLEKLAQKWGVEVIWPFRSAGRYISRPCHSCLSSAEMARSMDGRSFLRVGEGTQPLMSSMAPMLSDPPMIRVRWYTSRTLDTYEETLEPLERCGFFSLGRIARQRGVANVQVFDPHDKVRYATRGKRALYTISTDDAIDEVKCAMYPDGYLALTEASPDLPTKELRQCRSYLYLLLAAICGTH